MDKKSVGHRLNLENYRPTSPSVGHPDFKVFPTPTATSQRLFASSKGAHNHIPPGTYKATINSIAELEHIVDATGFTGNGPERLAHSPATHKMLGGGGLTDLDPAFGDSTRLQHRLKSKNKKNRADGSGQYTNDLAQNIAIRRSVEKKLPIDRQYIHSVKQATMPGGRHNVWCVCVFRLIAKAFLLAEVTSCDFTYKPFGGGLTEWVLVFWIAAERWTGVRVIADTDATTASFTVMVREVFDTLALTTGQPLRLAIVEQFCGRTGRLQYYLVDQEKAQILALGEYSANIMARAEY